MDKGFAPFLKIKHKTSRKPAYSSVRQMKNRMAKGFQPFLKNEIIAVVHCVHWDEK